MPITLLIILATMCGALVGLGTELTMSREKAHNLPGGSLASGLLLGAFLGVLLGVPGHGLVSLFVGGACGVAGWLLYRVLTPIGAGK
jgi:hypothetical protein